MFSIKHLTPYERLFGHKPSYTHMRAFGCLCFVSTHKQGRTKFDTRAHPCVFLGYPFGQKAYKVYDITTKRIIVSRDVKFFEKHFPFHFNPHGMNSNPAPFFLPASTSQSFHEETSSSTFFDNSPPTTEIDPHTASPSDNEE